MDLTIHVLRSYGNNVAQAKRSIRGERRAEQRMQKKMSSHTQMDSAIDKISSESAISEEKMDDLRIKT